MKLLVTRDQLNPNNAIGTLYIDGKFECFTLEDAVRQIEGQPVTSWKIPGKTAIPRGTYPVTITMSHHFGKLLPLLGGVEGFEGVRLHSGNTEADSEGCILLGDTRLPISIGNSRIAAARVQGKIQAALNRGEEVAITVQ